MRLKLIAIVGLLVVTAALIAVSIGAFGAPTTGATSFLTAAATTTDVTDEVTATGTIASADTYELAFGSANATVAWPVTDVAVRVGDRVTEGQTLATAATTDLEAQISDARLTAKSAALQLTQARATLDDATTTAAKRQARISLYTARAAKARADADLADLVAQRPLGIITAPGDGIITEVAIEAGEDAPQGAAITVAAAGLEVSTSVVESDVAKISVGQKATVTIDAIAATLRGTVAAIAPTATDASGGSGSGVVSYAVTIALDAPPASLRPGMSADVSIVTATASNVIAIPSRALSGSAGSYTVRVVADDGTVATRSVEVGLVTSSLAEITSGLADGERVVTGSSSDQNAVNNARGFFGGPAGGGTVVTEGR